MMRTLEALRRQPLRLLATISGLVVGLAGCTASAPTVQAAVPPSIASSALDASPSTDTSASTVTSAPSSPSITPAPAAPTVSACTGKQLTDGGVNGEGATQNWFVWIHLQNTSSAPCRIEGYPQVMLTGRNGWTKQLALRQAGQGATWATYVPGVVQPGSYAVIALAHLSDGSTCASRGRAHANGLQIALPVTTVHIADPENLAGLGYLEYCPIAQAQAGVER